MVRHRTGPSQSHCILDRLQDWSTIALRLHTVRRVYSLAVVVRWCSLTGIGKRQFVECLGFRMNPTIEPAQRIAQMTVGTGETGSGSVAVTSANPHDPSACPDSWLVVGAYVVVRPRHCRPSGRRWRNALNSISKEHRFVILHPTSSSALVSRRDFIGVRDGLFERVERRATTAHLLARWLSRVLIEQKVASHVGSRG